MIRNLSTVLAYQSTNVEVVPSIAASHTVSFRRFERDITRIGTGLLGGKVECLAAVSQSIHAASSFQPHLSYDVTVPHMYVIATDFFDGYFARKLKQVSDMGKFLDPLADKIALGVMVVYLALKNLTPLWFVIILLTRDVFVFIFGIIISRKQKTVVQSNIWGKLCTTVLSLYFLLCIVNILVDLKIVLLIFLTLSLIFLTISTVSYLLPYIKKKT